MFSPSPHLRRAAPRLALAAVVSMTLAGCGAAFPAGSTGSGGLALHTGTGSVRTGSRLRLSASVQGEPISAQWRVLSSTNAPALGPGSVAGDGTYTPPGALSSDPVSVTLEATAPDGATAVTTLTLHPGFAQPLTPENAALAPSSSLLLRAQIAEVSAGSVRWKLTSTSLPAEAAGTLSDEHCEHSRSQFTTCTVLYTAPPAPLPAATAGVTVTATLPGAGASTRATLMLRADGLLSNPVTHQAEQGGGLLALGTSGGNDNDFDTFRDAATGTRFVADCCGGTLGALLEDRSGTRFALSNNHVLALSDQGQRGDTVAQPGLIDDACVPLSEAGAHLQAVGRLEHFVPLALPETNVDAALALLGGGAGEATGAILELSSPGRGALGSAQPTAGSGEVLDAARLDGLHVVKSGRTTGLTCSAVEAVDLTVRVDYFKDCAEAQPLMTKTFTGQIGVGGATFADAGDSGALVLDAANSRAVGLLYATGLAAEGGTGLTLANPIGEVLSELSDAAGSPLSIVGSATPHATACLDYDAPESSSAFAVEGLAPDEKARAIAAAESALALRGTPGVATVAPGRSADHPSEAAILVTLAPGASAAAVPPTVDGVRTVVFSDAGPDRGLHLSPAALARAEAAVSALAPRLVRPGSPVLGLGASESLDAPGEPALLLLLDASASQLATAALLEEVAGLSGTSETALPPLLQNLRTRYLSMQRFRVTGSKYTEPGTPGACSVRRVAAAGAGRER